MNVQDFLNLLQTAATLVCGGLALYFKFSTKAKTKAKEVLAKYADVELIKGTTSEEFGVEAIVATPNVIKMEKDQSENPTATLSVLGVRSLPYSNITLDNTKCTFTSTDGTTAEVSPAGVITGKKVGNTTITVSYQGLQDIVTVNITQPS